MTTYATARPRAIALSREGSVFRLTFRYDPLILERVRTLPYATFDSETKSWTAAVCDKSVQELRRWHYEGLLDLGPDAFLVKGEDVPKVQAAVLRTGTSRKPYYVHFATRDTELFPAFRAIPGAAWVKTARALSYPPHAAAALAEMVDKGHLSDPESLLATDEDGVSVLFDTRVGRFHVRGDGRAASAFAEAFPHTDVLSVWQSKGLSASLFDDFAAQMYYGELARVGDGHQPDGMLIDLKEYQRQAVAMALVRPGLGIFDEPGLGKTVQGIAIGSSLLAAGRAARVVVVVPSNVRTQWAAEIQRFTGTPATDIAVVRGATPAHRHRAYEAVEAGARWLIVHYDVLGRDFDHLVPLFAGASVILDEAHRVKNWQAKRSEYVRTLCAGAVHRVALTGTPVETEPGEWFELLNFITPGCLGNPVEFNERYRYKAKFGGYEGRRNLHELRQRSEAYFVRRTKAQVAKHLPPLQVTTRILDASPAYEAMLRLAHSEAAKEIGKTRAAGVVAQTRRENGGVISLLEEERVREAESGSQMTAAGQLRLLCSSPRLISEDSEAGRTLIDAGLVPDEDGPKVDEIRSICRDLLAVQTRRLLDRELSQNSQAPTPDEVTGERIVLFTFSKRMANLLSQRLNEDGVRHVLYTGDTSDAERDAAVAAFTDPGSDVVAFVATDAASEGLNLGRCCARLVNVDLPWTPTRLAQRSQRIHRLDSTAPRYEVTNLMVGGTMEHGMLQLLESRVSMSDALLGEQGGKASTTGSQKRSSRRTVNFFEDALRSHQADAPAAPIKRRRRSEAADPASTAASAKAAAAPGSGEACDDVEGQLTLL